MGTKTSFGVALGLLLAPTLASAAPVLVDIVGALPASEYSTYIASTTYRDWGNEPFIAVNPVNPQEVVVSSFAYFANLPRGTASLWVSENGGADWGIRFPVNRPPSNTNVPDDWNFAFDSSGVLHGAVLGFDGNIYHGTTASPNNDGLNGRPASSWSWTATRVNAVGAGTSDQPWISVGNGRVSIGYDNFNSSFTQVQERVVTSSDNGATFPSDSPISGGGQVSTNANPGTRIARDGNGNVYAIFAIGQGTSGPANDLSRHMFYRLNWSSDGGVTWNLTNASGAPGGLPIDDGFSRQLTNSFGGVNQLRGDITAIAASHDGQHIYVVYGKQDVNGVDRLYLAEFHPDPGNPANLLMRGSPVAFSIAGQRAALPSITVTDDGTIAVLYYTVDANNQFHVHVASSNDLGLSFLDADIYDFSAPFNPGDTGSTNSTRIFGDYIYLESLGDTVYGTFAGRGDVNSGGTNTTGFIDPFFFAESFAVAEPSTLGVLGMALLGLLARRRRLATPRGSR